MLSPTESPTEKFYARKEKAKTGAKKKANGEAPVTANKKADWNEKLKQDPFFALAEKAGFNTSFAVSDEDGYRKTIEMLREQLIYSSDDRRSNFSPDDLNFLLEESAKEKKKLQEQLVAEEAQAKQPQAEPERNTLEVEGAPKKEEQNQFDWIDEKRKFWTEYAQSVENKFENNPEKDTASKTFNCTLSKDDFRGEITYTTPSAAQVSKESHLELYQGLVKDALENNLSITFGQTLDDTQKAMLFAACLLNSEKYNNGEDLALVNPPKIDREAEYFKQLPENVQQAINAHFDLEENKAKQAEIDNRLKSIKGRLNANKDKDGNKLTSEQRYAMRTEQLNTLQEQVALDPSKHTSTGQEAAERIMAARMGIIEDPNIKDTDGKQITKNEAYIEKASKKNPALQAYLTAKYGTEGK